MGVKKDVDDGSQGETLIIWVVYHITDFSCIKKDIAIDWIKGGFVEFFYEVLEKCLGELRVKFLPRLFHDVGKCFIHGLSGTIGSHGSHTIKNISKGYDIGKDREFFVVYAKRVSSPLMMFVMAKDSLENEF